MSNPYGDKKSRRAFFTTIGNLDAHSFTAVSYRTAVSQEKGGEDKKLHTQISPKRERAALQHSRIILQQYKYK